MSRGDLAREVRSRSPRQLDRYFAGTAAVPAEVIREVAIATGVSADFIVGVTDDPVPLAVRPARPEEAGGTVDRLLGELGGDPAEQDEGQDDRDTSAR